MKQSHRLFRIMALLLAILSLTLTGWIPTSYARDAKEVPILKVGHVGHDHQIALGVAALEGVEFKDQCGAWLEELKPREVYRLHENDEAVAELHLFKVQGGSAMPAAMERGELDIGLGGVAAVAFFVDKGNDFKIIAGLNTDGDMLVMKPGFGASNWKQFVAKAKATEKPLVIGYKAPVAVAKLIFERGLAAEGIEFGAEEGKENEIKVQLVDLHGQKNMIPALASGAVDGFVTNEPAASLAEVKKVGQIVCDLADLPPAGKWRDHPCCCVAARSEVLKEHPDIVTDLLKTLHTGTESILADRQQAAEIASKWTKTPLEVEQKSVANIRYLTRPDAAWKRGVITWIEMMQVMGTFKERFKSMKPKEVLEQLCDFQYIEKAASESTRSTGNRE